MIDFEIKVNEKKGAVTAFLTVDGYRQYLGIAKCNPSDVFDAEKGTSIAKKRALIAMKYDDIKSFNGQRSYHESRINHYNACTKRSYAKIRKLYDEIREISKN